MPRYFFNTRIGDDLIPDQTGADLRDPDQAWAVARTTALQLLTAGSADAAGSPLLMTAILEVTDSAGEIVLEYPLSEALIDPDAPLTVH